MLSRELGHVLTLEELRLEAESGPTRLRSRSSSYEDAWRRGYQEGESWGRARWTRSPT